MDLDGLSASTPVNGSRNLSSMTGFLFKRRELRSTQLRGRLQHPMPTQRLGTTSLAAWLNGRGGWDVYSCCLTSPGLILSPISSSAPTSATASAKYPSCTGPLLRTRSEPLSLSASY